MPDVWADMIAGIGSAYRIDGDTRAGLVQGVTTLFAGRPTSLGVCCGSKCASGCPESSPVSPTVTKSSRVSRKVRRAACDARRAHIRVIGEAVRDSIDSCVRAREWNPSDDTLLDLSTVVAEFIEATAPSGWFADAESLVQEQEGTFVSRRRRLNTRLAELIHLGRSAHETESESESVPDPTASSPRSGQSAGGGPIGSLRTKFHRQSRTKRSA